MVAALADIDDATLAEVRGRALTVSEPATVDAAFDRMAGEISARLAGRRPLVLAVMVGGLIPCARLLSRVDFALDLDYVHATRYRGGVRGHEVEWRVLPGADLSGRLVLVVDDVLDRGFTLAAILGWCHQRGAREVLSAVVVDKQVAGRRAVPGADFTGVSAPDQYLFGCGMDFRGQFRHLRGVYAVAAD